MVLQYGKAGSGGKGEKGGNPACKVYVCQLPYKVTWQDLKDHFGQVGTVVYSNVFCEQNVTGEASANPLGWSKGNGVVEFSTAEEAELAIQTMNGTPMGSRSIVVQSWTGHDEKRPARAGGKGKGYDAVAYAPAKGKGYEGKGKKRLREEGSLNPKCKVYVGQLPYSTTWQDLKDIFSEVGEVTYANVFCEPGVKPGMRTANPSGYSKGRGVVEFATQDEARAAILSMNGHMVGTRSIVVEPWSEFNGQPAPGKDTDQSAGETWQPQKYGGAGKGFESGSQKGGAVASWNRAGAKGAAKGGGKSSLNPECKVFVGQLPYSLTWQDLKTIFAQAGTVTYANILMEQGMAGKGGKHANPEGWSKGMGVVEFSSPEEALQAIVLLNGMEIKSRKITVMAWRTDADFASTP
mmetsp:Transcript_85872/g.156498  ORF Transcript_85872/g.156498 Transcript_85872/m.156498 type:complete len:407 (-) Transcript_85872:32-1252(-)